jgi:hypothetical protein
MPGMKTRFTIRDLLWLTAIIALSLGWWLHYRQMQATIARLQNTAPVVSIADERVEKAMQFDTVAF